MILFKKEQIFVVTLSSCFAVCFEHTTDRPLFRVEGSPNLFISKEEEKNQRNRVRKRD
jgi:organic hydroperoxide reductase OsmC/OhrA